MTGTEALALATCREMINQLLRAYSTDVWSSYHDQLYRNFLFEITTLLCHFVEAEDNEEEW